VEVYLGFWSLFVIQGLQTFVRFSGNSPCLQMAMGVLILAETQSVLLASA
jgi:hypothetical protein